MHTGRAPDQSPLRHLIIAVIVVDYVSGKSSDLTELWMPHFKSNRPTLSEGCQCVQSPCCRRRLQGRSCRSSCRSPPRSLRLGSTAPRRGRCQRRLLRGGPVQGAEDEKTSWILELGKKPQKYFEDRAYLTDQASCSLWEICLELSDCLFSILS